MAFPNDPLAVRVRIAPGFSTASDPSGWTWVDISSYVRTPRDQPTYSIAHGKIGNVREAPPALATLVVENGGGEFGTRNPNGPWYGDLVENTPLDIALDAGAGYVTRFTGGLAGMPREWDSGGRNSWVMLTARGNLFRLTQRGRQFKSAFTRHMERNDWSELIGWWPMEDAADSTRAAGGLVMRDGAQYQVPPMTLGGSARFGVTAPASGVSSLVDLSNGYLAANLPVGLDSNEWRINCNAIGDIGSITTQTRIASWITRGTVIRWDLVANDGVVAIHGYDTTAAQVINFTATFDADDGELHHYRVDAYDDLGTLTVELWIDDVFLGSDTLAATVTHQPTYIRAHPDAESFALAMNHLIVWSPRPTDAPTLLIPDATFGWAGEMDDARFSRTADEEGIPYNMSSFLLVPMGPQSAGKVVDIWRECEKTGRAMLTDGLDGKIRYRSISDLQNQSAALTLSYTGRQVFGPFLPADDATWLANDVTARRLSGSSARAVDQVSIDARGAFEDTIDVNPFSDHALENLAGWYRRLGTVDADRYDNIRLQMAHPRMASKVAAWLATEPGDRLTISDLPLSVHPEGTDPDLMIRGWVEEVTLPRMWTVDLSCEPYEPYDVGVVGTDKLQVGRTATGAGARLASALTTSATSMSVAVGIQRYQKQAIPRFTTNGAHYPTLMKVGGEHVNVTAMAAATTITFVATGTAAHADDAAVVPGLPAGMQAGDLMIMFAAARNTGIPTAPAGWSSLSLPAVDFNVMVKVHSGSESAPTVTPASGGAGNTMSAQITAFRGAFSTPGTVVRAVGVENASAQNISYPAMRVPKEHTNCLIIWFGRKRDDWTGVTSPGTEISEPSSTLGSDQGLVWAFQIQTTPTDIAAGSFTVSGGAAATSDGAVIAFRSNVQVATVTRSANRIVKAHDAGASVELVAPIYGAVGSN
jgi:hypothetical protein